MTLAPSLAIKMLGGIALTAFWLVPLHISRAESSLWQLTAWQPTATTAVGMTGMDATEPDTSSSVVNGVRSQSTSPFSPKIFSVSLHSRYFSTGTSLIYTW
ncbi:hypothetical protein U2F10_24720 [Leptothoe sp. EHU-05/26/07-4]